MADAMIDRHSRGSSFPFSCRRSMRSFLTDCMSLWPSPVTWEALVGGAPLFIRQRYPHGERTKAAIAERQKFSALLKMLRDGLAW